MQAVSLQSSFFCSSLPPALSERGALRKAKQSLTNGDENSKRRSNTNAKSLLCTQIKQTANVHRGEKNFSSKDCIIIKSLFGLKLDPLRKCKCILEEITQQDFPRSYISAHVCLLLDKKSILIVEQENAQSMRSTVDVKEKAELSSNCAAFTSWPRARLRRSEEMESGPLQFSQEHQSLFNRKFWQRTK